jgi:hypothetical protein
MIFSALTCFILAVISGVVGLLAGGVAAERVARTLFGGLLFAGLICFIIAVLRQRRASVAD